MNPFNNLLKSLMFYYFDKFHQHTGFGASGFADTFFINIVRFFCIGFFLYHFVCSFFANLPILFYRFSTQKKQEANINIWFYLLFLWTVYLVTNKFLCLLKWVWVSCLNRTCCVAIIFSRIIHEGILPPTVVLWNVRKMLSMRTMIIKYCTYLFS